MRKLSGFDQPRAVDIAVRPVLKLAYGIADRSPRLKLAVAQLIAPSLAPVAAPYILGVAPISDEVLTPSRHAAATAMPNPLTHTMICAPGNNGACSAKAARPATKG